MSTKNRMGKVLIINLYRMNFNIYKCRAQNRDFISIESEESINDSLEKNNIEKSDLQKRLQRNDPEGYNVFYAELFSLEKHKSLFYETISYEDTIKEDIEPFNAKLRYLTFNNVTFMTANINAEYFSNLYLVKSMHINGLSKGAVDLSRFSNLEYINILKWNSKVKLANNNTNLKRLIVWRYNPKTKSLNDLLGKLESIEYLELNLTNIQNLEGIEQLINLKKIVINYGSNLKSVINLYLCKQLEHIRFNNCKKIEDIYLLEKKENLIIDNVNLRG